MSLYCCSFRWFIVVIVIPVLLFHDYVWIMLMMIMGKLNDGFVDIFGVEKTWFSSVSLIEQLTLSPLT